MQRSLEGGCAFSVDRADGARALSEWILHLEKKTNVAVDTSLFESLLPIFCARRFPCTKSKRCRSDRGTSRNLDNICDPCMKSNRSLKRDAHSECAKHRSWYASLFLTMFQERLSCSGPTIPPRRPHGASPHDDCGPTVASGTDDSEALDRRCRGQVLPVLESLPQ